MTSAEAFFVSRTLQAIEVLAFQPSSAPQVAGALQVHPRTARRLLNRLVADGWATRSDGRRRTYAPTMRIVALAAQLAERAPLAVAATPIVGRLHEETGAVAHLTIPSYHSALCLVHRAGGPDARPQLRELAPAHATAAGKVLLAFRDPWRDSVLARELERTTERTITAPDELRAEVEAIRERGHALEDEELVAGIRAVAVPVRGASGEVGAALGLSGPAADFDVALLTGLAELLQTRAAEIERAFEEGSAHG
jgi:DNA-binding IclR family transcriptional regulator